MRPSLEVLEERVVPYYNLLTGSINWAGYAILGAPYSVTSASGSWTVPAVHGSGTAYSSTWVGIDGLNAPSYTVEQIGTAQEVHGGKASYYPWYEMFPLGPVVINHAISPGDVVSASVKALESVSYNPDPVINPYAQTFVLSMTDQTAGWSFSVSLGSASTGYFGGTLLSAEWIVERPWANGSISTLANFGSVKFTNCQATLGPQVVSGPPLSVTGPIDTLFLQGQCLVEQINMYSQSFSNLANTGPFADFGPQGQRGSSFVVNYGGNVPAAPTTGDPAGIGQTGAGTGKGKPPPPPPAPKPAPGVITAIFHGELAGLSVKKRWVAE